MEVRLLPDVGLNISVLVYVEAAKPSHFLPVELYSDDQPLIAYTVPHSFFITFTSTDLPALMQIRLLLIIPGFEAFTSSGKSGKATEVIIRR